MSFIHLQGDLNEQDETEITEVYTDIVHVDQTLEDHVEEDYREMIFDWMNKALNSTLIERDGMLRISDKPIDIWVYIPD